MFKSAALKLTAWYLAIVMLVSIGSSVALYNVSSSGLAQSTKRQLDVFQNQLSQSDFNTFSAIRQRQLDEDVERLKNNLLLFNLVVLVSGGAACYMLARRTLDPIERALDAQKRFTADASHELRTPLAVMQAEIEVALRDKKISQREAVKMLESNLEEVIKLRTLSDSLLSLAAERNGEMKVVPVPIKTIVGEVLNRQKKSATAKNIPLKFKGSRRICVRANKQSIVELVNILVDNAVKYSPQGKPVVIEVKKSLKIANISIKDQGIGIDKKDLPHVFDRFYRADSSRNKADYDGYGLGLSIASKIAELNGGGISAKSKIGRGSTFTVSLPVV